MGDSVKKYFEMNDTNDNVNTEINYVNSPNQLSEALAKLRKKLSDIDSEIQNLENMNR
tara:strand:+ start:758 stop:931 length:174 start_codon:yes stop_codon:yes gene_type:complete